MNKRYIPIAVAVLLGLTAATQTSSPNFLVSADDYENLSCYLYKDLTLFDLKPLYKDTGYTNAGYKINFCKSFDITDPNNSSNTIQTYAYKQSSGVVYADGDILPAQIEVIENEEGVRHVKYLLDTNTTCTLEDGNVTTYDATYEVFCNADGNRDDSLTDVNVELTDVCSIYVTATHKTGCPIVQATSIVEFLTNNPWIMGIILIVFGIVATFFGGKFFPYVLATVGGGMTFLALLVLASAFGMLTALESKSTKSGSNIAICVITILVCAALGAFVGWFVKKARRLGGAILGGAAGFFIGLTLFNLVFAQWLDYVAALIIISFGCAAVGAWAAWKFDKIIIVYLTALVGAYALIRGIAVFAGNYPNEITMFQEIMQGVFELPTAFYYYLAGFAVTALVGIVVQHKLGFHLHKHEDDGYSKIN